MSKMQFRENNRVRWRGSRPAHEGEQVEIYGTVSNDTIAIYTVPAGKVLFLCEWAVVQTSSVTGAYLMGLRDGADATTRHLAGGKHVTTYGWGSDNGKAWPPIEVPAGYDVYLYSDTAGQSIRGSAHGWIEDAL